MVKPDRFIPPRFKNVDIRNTKFQLDIKNDQYSKELQKRLFSKEIVNETILAFNSTCVSKPVNLRNIYSNNLHGINEKKVKIKHRKINSNPERILDAPAFMNDYYLNLLDWSSCDVIAVALSECVYLWNANTGGIHKLMTMTDNNDYISSVSWIEDGSYLAIGTSKNQVEIWDIEKLKKCRTMGGHNTRDGTIFNHDVRIQNHIVGLLQGHNKEVCGLKWSPNGKYLASGGNDDILNIWDINKPSINKPLYKLYEHKAAVKGIAWCPWKQDLLATGGGAADCQLKFWNTTTGKCLKSIDTKSQISSIIWSKYNREFVTSHGFQKNCLTVWKYKNFQKMIDLTGHTSRVLSMALSPDGEMVVSAGADETLRFWKVFEQKKLKNRFESFPFTKAIELR